MITQISFALLNGLTVSMAVFLVAAGVTLIFGILKILNFAHGSFFMIGAYIGLTIMGVRPETVAAFLLASIAAGLAVGGLGYLTNLTVLRRLRGLDEATTLIATFSLLLIFDGAVKLIWGLNYVSVPPPPSLGGFQRLGPVLLTNYSAFVIATAVIVFVLLEIVLHRMWIGKTIRALAKDPWMASNLGINVNAIYAGVVVAAFFLAGFAGALLLPNQTLSPSLSGTYLLQAFVVVIIGGLGNVRGAFVASILLGLVDSLNFLLLPNAPGLAIYVAMVAALLWRPQGILSGDDSASEDIGPHVSTPYTDAILPPAARHALIAAVTIAVITLPFWADNVVLYLGGLTLGAIVFALSWNLMFGFTGLASFGHAAFFAIGAYLCGYLLRFHTGLPFIASVALGGLAGGAVAWAVGIIALRRMSGISLAILTLALGEILKRTIAYIDILGAEDGLSGIPRPIVSLGPLSLNLSSDEGYYWFLCLSTGALIVALRLLTAARFGRVLRAIRQEPKRTEFLGINVMRYRVRAFTIAGTVASVVGALQAPWTRIVTPEIASYLHSTEPMLASLLGGINHFWGPAIGAFVFASLGYATRTLPGVADMISGGVLLTIVLVAPTGILGGLSILLRGRGSLIRSDLSATVTHDPREARR